MEPWKDFLVELAKKLTAPFAFAILVILAVAWYGRNIPSVFQALIYVVVIGALAVYALPKVFAVIPTRRRQEPLEQPTSTQPPSPAPSPVTEEEQSPEDITQANYAAARENYLEAILQDCSALRLVGVDPTKADPVRGGLSLEKVYISLDTRTTVQEGEEEGKKSRQKREELSALLEREKPRPLPALEALVQCLERRMVLLGLPGTGKSTFVRYLSLRMAQAFYSDRYNLPDLLFGWQGRALLPVIVPLGRLAESLPDGVEKGKAELVEQFLKQMLEDDPRLADFAPHLLKVLKEEGGLVMFDGLDEVANLNLRPIVIEAIETFANRYGKNLHNRFLVTCRTYSYYHDRAWQLTGWETHELALLDEPKIKQFVEAWYAEHTRLEPARRDDFAHKKDNLLKSLHPEDRRRLFEIAPFPIILTMMAVVHTHYGELPDTRAQVYERCTDLLLVRWDLERTVLPGKKRKQSLLDALGVQRGRLDAALREVAFKAHQGFAERTVEKKPADGPALVTEDLLSGVLQVYLQDAHKVQTFLDYCQSANGLLMLQWTVRDPEAPEDVPPRRVYAFPHHTFPEYPASLLRGRAYQAGPDILR